MLETAVITFREGLEMFLIVAIMLAYLVRTGRKNLKRPVYLGVVAAALISVTAGWHIAELAEDPVMEGWLAITAGVLVASLTWMVMKGAQHIRNQIAGHLETHASRLGFAAAVGVFVFTVLMISREGMETAMMLGALSGTMNVTEMALGAGAGFAAVGVIGWLWVSQSERINLRLFMQVTGVFLMLFCAHLFLYGFHELTEAGVVPGIDNFYWHTLTEPLEPGEPVGQVITISMLAIPVLWLVVGYVRDRVAQVQAFGAAAE